ncbi:vacuolar protein [Cryptococcus neoformans]|nr:vacuolar protein [Cryptococcus neoformans var. grubii AD1-7a]OXH34315.1 vacuolar protein [Cryptococcus neoformans var. grubii]
MAGRYRGKSSKVGHFFGRIPLYFSYLILASGWLLFMLFVNLGEVLIKRREIGRFLEQVITFNTLFFLTVLSLITASLRSPGSPDKTLAPTSSAPGFSLIRPRQGRKQHPSKNDHLSVHPAVEKSKPQSNIKIKPPPSLKFLRNPQWVSSRLHKDRPSPLPLFKNQPYPSVPSTPDSPSTDDSDSCESDETGWSDLDSESESESDYSPFPLSPSPRNNDRDDDVDNDGDEGEHVRLLIVEKGHAQTHDNMSEKADSSTSTSMPRMDTSITATGKTQSRWCKQCNAWKPDRTHHCRHCHRCVLKILVIVDHHCPWVGTCVGYRNYKPFLLFITYGTLLAIYITFETGYEVYLYLFYHLDHSASSHQNNLSSPSSPPVPISLQLGPAVSMMLLAMGIFITLSVGGLACFHWWLASENMTTLESITHSYPTSLLSPLPPSHDTSPSSPFPSASKLPYKQRQSLSRKAQAINVYDLGWRRNLKQVFFASHSNHRARGPDHPGDGRRCEDANKRMTIGMILGAMWPTNIGYDQSHPLAGHVFPYDPCALEQLKTLTEKLRSSTLTFDDKDACDACDRGDNGESASDVGSGCESEQGEDDVYHDEENAIGFGGKNKRYKVMDEKLTMPRPDKVDINKCSKETSVVPRKNRDRGVNWFQV